MERRSGCKRLSAHGAVFYRTGGHPLAAAAAAQLPSISMACGISSRKSLFEGCTLTGRLLRQAIGWAGKAFAALMSIQRVVTVQLDRSASRLGQLLTGSVPIVGRR